MVSFPKISTNLKLNLMNNACISLFLLLSAQNILFAWLNCSSFIMSFFKQKHRPSHSHFSQWTILSPCKVKRAVKRKSWKSHLWSRVQYFPFNCTYVTTSYMSEIGLFQVGPDDASFFITQKLLDSILLSWRKSWEMENSCEQKREKKVFNTFFCHLTLSCKFFSLGLSMGSRGQWGYESK